MFCQKCGAQMSPTAGFCSNCGARVQTVAIRGFAAFSKSGLSKSEVTLPCALSTAQVDERMCCCFSRGNILLVGRNILPDGFEYSLTSPMGLFSWGELMYVRCMATPTGSMVNIFSKCTFPLQLIAWGKHDRNIRQIASALSIPY